MHRRLFGLSPSKTNTWQHLWLAVLDQTMAHLGEHPARRAEPAVAEPLTVADHGADPMAGAPRAAARFFSRRHRTPDPTSQRRVGLERRSSAARGNAVSTPDFAHDVGWCLDPRVDGNGGEPASAARETHPRDRPPAPRPPFDSEMARAWSPWLRGAYRPRREGLPADRPDNSRVQPRAAVTPSLLGNSQPSRRSATAAAC